LEDTPVTDAKPKRLHGEVSQDDSLSWDYARVVEDNPSFAIFKDRYTAVTTVGLYLSGMYNEERDKLGKPTKNALKFRPNLTNNPYGLKLFTDYEKLGRPYSVSQYEGLSNALVFQYYVMYIISQRIQNMFEASQDWLTFIDGASARWKAGVAYSMQNLGSDLHTTAADASTDVTIDVLARRLDQLRDW